MPIDTTKVTNRRALRFESLEALASDAQALAEGERLGKLVARGNWSLGQAINHVAVWIELAYADHVPVKVSWFQRLLAPFAKKLHNEPIDPGYRFEGTPDGTLGTEPAQTEPALARLRRAIDRLRVEPPQTRDPLFGWLTHEQWIALQLRHGELHFSFFELRDTPPRFDAADPMNAYVDFLTAIYCGDCNVLFERPDWGPTAETFYQYCADLSERAKAAGWVMIEEHPRCPACAAKHL